MYLIYTPEGQEEQRWVFQPGRLRTAEMIAIERRTGGLKYGTEFKDALMRGDTLARKALLWTLLRRTHHTISFDDVDFYDDELKLVLDRDELAAEIAALEEFAGVTEDQRMAGLALLRAQLADAPYAPGKDPAPTPTEPAVRHAESAPPQPPADLVTPAGPPLPVPVTQEPVMPPGPVGVPTTMSTASPPETWPTSPTPAPALYRDPSRH